MKGTAMLRLLLLSALFFTPAAIAQETPPAAEVDETRIVPKGWEGVYNQFHYAPAVRAGNTLYLSGIVATLTGDENEQNPADVEAAFDRAFQSIGAVLKEAGADWSDVVEMTTFHTELIPQIQPFTASKDKFIKAPYPAWTAIDVDRLYPERGLVEIKVIAYVGEER